MSCRSREQESPTFVIWSQALCLSRHLPRVGGKEAGRCPSHSPRRSACVQKTGFLIVEHNPARVEYSDIKLSNYSGSATKASKCLSSRGEEVKVPRMSRPLWIAISALLLFPVCGHAENVAGQVRRAVEHSTLDRAGTKPFHLKAVLAPSLERDKDSGRTGEVEIWWQSPTRWKRELRSPEFHQIEIVDGSREWQKNEGDYFPEWLREMATELVKPIPALEEVLDHAKSAQVRNFDNPVNRSLSMVNIDWVTNTGTAEVRNIRRSGVALRASTGELLYAYGFGWGGEFKDAQNFHGRMVARTVSLGSPEVTAKVLELEELGEVPAAFFDAGAEGGDPRPLQTLLIDETTLRKNLLPGKPITWPPLQDGVLQGNVTTEVVVDREGRVRDISSIISENSRINDAGRQQIAAMRFNPFLLNGVPVQVMSQVTVPFKTVRPAGTEIFESARTYFERGRKVGFLAAGSEKSYVLRAEFQAKGSGGVENGHYEDTWVSNTKWRREASFGRSRYVRSRNGEKRYDDLSAKVGTSPPIGKHPLVKPLAPLAIPPNLRHNKSLPRSHRTLPEQGYKTCVNDSSGAPWCAQTTALSHCGD